MHKAPHPYRAYDIDAIGFLSYDACHHGPRPAVLICHAWAGRDEFACLKVQALASLGYVGLALDVYGGAKVGESVEENTALMTPLMEDRGLLRQRLLAGVEAARSIPEVDENKIAVMGYCFGGLCALDIARSGEAVKGAVSFHGLLGAPSPAPGNVIQAKVLALHGYDDPMVKPAQLVAFADEMTKAKADWQIHAYGHTVHAFTNPNANNAGMGTVYDEKAAKRSLKASQNFLDEIFAPRHPAA